MKIITGTTILAGLALAVASYAAPTLMGLPGGVITPQANFTLVPQTTEVAYDHFLSGAEGTNSLSLIRANYALNGSTSAGITANVNENGYSLNRLGANITYRLPKLAKFPDDIAVSASYQGLVHNSNIGGLGLNGIWQASVVGTHDLRKNIATIDPEEPVSPLVSASYGLNLTRTTGSTILRPFVGLNMAFGDIEVNAELQANSAPYDRAILGSLSARAPITDNITVQGGLSNAVEGTFGGKKLYPFIGVKYNFAKKPEIIIPNVPPTVFIASIPESDEFVAPANVKINVIAEDTDGAITKVEFYNGDTLLATDTYYPFSYTWPDVAAGVYNIKVIAYDDDNATATTTFAVVTVKPAGAVNVITIP